MNIRRLFGLGALAIAASVAAAPSVSVAQNDYPTRPVKVIVPYSPGGSTDLTARLIAKHAEEHLGQPMVIENKPGAAAMIGLNELVNAKPDGYTLGMTNSGMVAQPIYGTAQYNYATDLQALAQVGEIPFVFAVRADAPWKTLQELIDHAKENPGAVKYGITGIGNTAHIGPEHLQLVAGIEMTPINFDGGAPLIAAMLGGHIDAAANNPVDLQEHIKAGRVRVLAVFGEQRLEAEHLKDVPTAKELGYDVVVTLWQGIGAPKDLPEEIKNKLDDVFRETFADPETQQAVRELGLEPHYLGADEFAEKWVTNQEHLRKVVTDTGILEAIQAQTK